MHTHTHTHTHTSFDNRAGRVACSRQRQFALASYSGVLCEAATQSLVRSVGLYAGRSPTFECIAGAMLVSSPDGYSGLGFMRGCSAGVVIVRPDQYEATVEMCQLLAGMGIVRTVWLISQVARAQAWLDRHS